LPLSDVAHRPTGQAGYSHAADCLSRFREVPRFEDYKDVFRKRGVWISEYKLSMSQRHAITEIKEAAMLKKFDVML